MANKKDLKAFVRYDGTGRLIAGSLILQRNKPKVGNWIQTNAYECCDPSCVAPTYGDDYIISNIAPYGIDQALITILLNPFKEEVIQGALYDCDGKLLAVSEILNVSALVGENYWVVPAISLFSSCSIKFRRICFDGNGQSNWKEAVPYFEPLT